MTSSRGQRWLIAVGTILSVLFLAKAAFWIAAGCPTGHEVTSSSVSQGDGRAITTSSDHLLTADTLTGDPENAVLELAGRRIVVKGNEASINGVTRIAFPAACKKREFVVRGKVLQILADGQNIAPIDVQ
jgi:hypothetical protein